MRALKVFVLLFAVVLAALVYFAPDTLTFDAAVWSHERFRVFDAWATGGAVLLLATLLVAAPVLSYMFFRSRKRSASHR